jgi:hypothetical protein
MSFDGWRRRWDMDDESKVDSWTFSESSKPMSQYVPQDLYLLPGSLGKAALPNLDWFPR